MVSFIKLLITEMIYEWIHLSDGEFSRCNWMIFRKHFHWFVKVIFFQFNDYFFIILSYVGLFIFVCFITIFHNQIFNYVRYCIFSFLYTFLWEQLCLNIYTYVSGNSDEFLYYIFYLFIFLLCFTLPLPLAICSTISRQCSFIRT